MINEHDNAPQRGGLASIVRGGLRLLGFVGLWFVLTRGQLLKAWYLGAATVVLATWATYWVAPVSERPRALMRPMGLVRFVPFFVRRSVIGAVDVARRALQPSRPLAPGLVDYPLRMRARSSATIAFVGVISLLPGTLCAGLGEASVTVHVVDCSQPIRDQLAELEEMIAAVFGEPIDQAPIDHEHHDRELGEHGDAT